MVTSDSEREAGGAGFDHWLPRQGQTGGSLGLTGSRWGLASGSGPGLSPTTATAPQTGRDRLLRTTWRIGATPQSGDGQALQGSDGLGGYRPAPAEFATGLFTRAWPWGQQQYALPSSQTQTQTQHRPQAQSNTNYGYGAASACTFSFHPITTTTSAPSSPFGPIAPPTPRSARPQQPDNHTTTTTATATSTRRSSPLPNRRASTTTTSPYAGPSSPLHAPAGGRDNDNGKENDKDNSEAGGGDEGQSRNCGLLRGLKFE
ncbi:6ea00d44-e586-46b8-adda-ae36203299a8 [Thermothielavioides terrestris]|uniref:6ea00d44-e586-46b8-adda-ae36203299a8 n=1 Tax=Thermothielavioides terrestris TaxID=2587410 RepID=A0A446BI71_9PEZI|nr:6ea00d44-e586-46b8-adda-ae36203299a8 [Thermothielavioides terrestris]